MSEGRRLKAIEYSVPLLARAVSGSRPGEFWRVQNPLPGDAAFLWCYQPSDGHSVVFVFQHDSFPFVSEGEEIPRETLVYESRLIEDAE